LDGFYQHLSTVCRFIRGCAWDKWIKLCE